MIYEIRTYNLKLGQLNEYWDRFSEKLPARQALSKLGAHWYTEVGPLNQMVAVWPYESLEQRAEIRRAAEAGPNPIWPPDTSDLIVSMVSEIFLPAPFMEPLGDRDIGPIYEMRLYTYPPEGMPQVLEAWDAAISERLKFSPLAGCWYSEYGGVNNFIHVWAYKSFEERARIRAETREQGVWPPKGSVRPITQESNSYCPPHFHQCSSVFLNVNVFLKEVGEVWNLVYPGPYPEMVGAVLQRTRSNATCIPNRTDFL